MDLSKLHDRSGLIGTIVFHALLVLLLIFLGKSCTSVQAEEDKLEDGGVAISIGEPDMGGPDNSSAQESYTPPTPQQQAPESYVNQNQDEAPEVLDAPPNPNPSQSQTQTSTPTTETTPVVTPPVITAPEFKGGGATGDDNTGDGVGDGPKKGRQGNDGPDKTGGIGNGGGLQGLGNGISGKGFGGFKVAKIAKPSSGSTKRGKVALDACVNSAGKVISVNKSKYIPDNATFDADLVKRAKAALYKFQFTNVSSSKGSCGTIVFEFKLN